MAINERERMALYDKLGQVLGTEQAGWMMELLPPTSWADLATKDDVAMVKQDVGVVGKEVRSEIKAGFATFEKRLAENDLKFAGLEQKMAEQTRLLVTLLIGFALTVWISLLAGALIT